ncbi:MAG: hypothetical protein IPH04_07545 [Saprospirales bacterium]|nr:hypothetical protein [Saprospirales bacterium]
MKKYSSLLLIPVFFLFTACGGNSEEKKAEKEAKEAAEQMEEASKNMEEAADNMRDAMTGNNATQNAQVVDWRKLQELLPNKIDGMPRTNESGETAGAMGFNFSQTEGTYEEGDRRINLKMMDTGGLSGLMSMSAAWATMTIDKEDRNGYERTTEIDGYKAFEKYNKNTEDGELSVLVGKRFIVTLDGRGVSMDDLRDALGDVELRKLEKLN